MRPDIKRRIETRFKNSIRYDWSPKETVHIMIGYISALYDEGLINDDESRKFTNDIVDWYEGLSK